MEVKKYSGIITILLFLSIPCATTLTFDLPRFPYRIKTISLEGDAFMDGKFLCLTKSAKKESQIESVSRATYTQSQPFLLRESTTGKLADFNTSFTFINSQDRDSYGMDGLATFLAPVGTLLLNCSIGVDGSLGLPVNNILPRNQYPFVPLEFVIFQNEDTAIGNPSYSYGHVGIDVHFFNSVLTQPCNVSIKEEHQNSVRICYNSSGNDISVAFTSYDDASGMQVMTHLSYKIDLRQILPDLVTVGALAGRPISTPQNIISWDFTSTSLVDNELPQLLRNRKRQLEVVISSIIGTFMLVSVIGLGVFNSCKNMARTESSTDIQGLRRFSCGEMALATRNFADGEKLGQRGHGEVYKGFRYDFNSYVAVERISKGSTQMKEYKSDLRILGRLRHPNVMELIGWCDEQGELILVYEFMPKGSLDYHLIKADNLLIWEVRYKIAQGLASALLYLHHNILNIEWEQRAHRNIQSSHIMLDSNLNAKLGNFLFTELVHGESQTTVVAGTAGYLDPAYLRTRKPSRMSDVYSFGVVVLEIACGRKPIEPNFEENQIYLVEWVWEMYREGKMIEAADPKLSGDFDEKQMECLMVVGLWCAHSDSSLRPSIDEAIQVFNFEAPLPLLIIKSYDTTGSSSETSTSESSNNSAKILWAENRPAFAKILWARIREKYFWAGLK